MAKPAVIEMRKARAQEALAAGIDKVLENQAVILANQGKILALLNKKPASAKDNKAAEEKTSEPGQ